MSEHLKTKHCSKCNEIKLLGEFYKNISYKDDHFCWCKTCMKVYYKTYIEIHRKEKAIYDREYRKSQREKIKAYNKQYREAHRKIYQLASLKHLALKANAAIDNMTPEDIKARFSMFGNRCYYCGQNHQRLVIEHRIPLSRGGPHCLSNIVPACKSCNSAKHDKTEREFAERI